MALKGPWGTFIHIPKCGGMAMRYFLRGKFKTQGVEINGQHDMPDAVDENTWTMVRHPAKWLLSYYTYIFENQWRWEERPAIIGDLLSSADGLFWPQYVEWVCKMRPGAIGKIFNSFCVDGVQLFQLEKIDLIFDEHVPFLHVSENKPLFTLDQWYMICEAEADTLKQYHYDDTPPEHLTPALEVETVGWKESV